MSDLKRAAAEAAIAYVEDGMRLGIGTGSTAQHFIELLGERVEGGLRVLGVATSERTAQQCVEFGIPLSSLDETPELDLTVDGADEIGPHLSLVKGGGGALLREKIVAYSSERLVVIADETKRVPVLGAFPLPIEVVPFGMVATRHAVERAARTLGMEGTFAVRSGREGPYRTDGGNHIIDASFGRIDDPTTWAATLDTIPGVVEHGLFVGMADIALIASATGVETLHATDVATAA